ncbi:hypothetical protein [Alcaligenes endophyticus]|uniref:Lipoprotein n=1 Tax=Alcaligenes endophyticus TaxID=1929088 RepID=A0ABT8ENL1_9BURK|nr:hypothetical protein [Alcaligenes endophyticus]MCX5592850.1 hypothetical protein [Alcaligenes endophyticus]MDN4122859.1 hypothetical protein [Alcaligenes endophyticus]
MRNIFVAVLLLALSGCAAPPPKMSRAEYLDAVQRSYEGKSSEDVFAAAEKVLTLMDGDDFTFHHSADSVTGMRSWLVFALLIVVDGVDTWTIKAVDTPTGTNATVSVATSTASAIAAPTGGAGVSSSDSGATPGQVSGTALYDLFWARMDYMLGTRSDWMTCDQAKTKLAAGETTGNLLQICDGITIKDESPE